MQIQGRHMSLFYNVQECAKTFADKLKIRLALASIQGFKAICFSYKEFVCTCVKTYIRYIRYLNIKIKGRTSFLSLKF